jgi:hypothetical protein
MALPRLSRPLQYFMQVRSRSANWLFRWCGGLKVEVRLVKFLSNIGTACFDHLPPRTCPTQLPVVFFLSDVGTETYPWMHFFRCCTHHCTYIYELHTYCLYSLYIGRGIYMLLKLLSTRVEVYTESNIIKIISSIEIHAKLRILEKRICTTARHVFDFVK